MWSEFSELTQVKATSRSVWAPGSYRYPAEEARLEEWGPEVLQAIEPRHLIIVPSDYRIQDMAGPLPSPTPGRRVFMVLRYR